MTASSPPRWYACPRCFVVAPGLATVRYSVGIYDVEREWMCDGCLGELRAAAAAPALLEALTETANHLDYLLVSGRINASSFTESEITALLMRVQQARAAIRLAEDEE